MYVVCCVNFVVEDRFKWTSERLINSTFRAMAILYRKHCVFDSLILKLLKDKRESQMIRFSLLDRQTEVWIGEINTEVVILSDDAVTGKSL